MRAHGSGGFRDEFTDRDFVIENQRDELLRPKTRKRGDNAH
jgi:hypothetical protein